MAPSVTAASVDFEVIQSLRSAERAHLELAEKLRIHREQLESIFEAHQGSAGLASRSDTEVNVSCASEVESKPDPATAELSESSSLASGPSPAPLKEGTTREASPPRAAPATKPSIISHRLVGDVIEGLVFAHLGNEIRFRRVDENTYLAEAGLDVYREVSEEPEAANVGAVRFGAIPVCKFWGKNPGSMVRLAGPEGYWLRVPPGERRVFGRAVGDINQDVIYDAQIPTLRRFELAEGEVNGQSVFREVVQNGKPEEADRVKSVGCTHHWWEKLVRQEGPEGWWIRA